MRKVLVGLCKLHESKATTRRADVAYATLAFRSVERCLQSHVASSTNPRAMSEKHPPQAHEPKATKNSRGRWLLPQGGTVEVIVWLNRGTSSRMQTPVRTESHPTKPTANDLSGNPNPLSVASVTSVRCF